MSWDNDINPANNQPSYENLELKKYRTSDQYGLPIYDYFYEVSLGKFTNKDIRKRKTKNLDLTYAVFGNPGSFIQEKGIWANIKNWYPTKGDYIYFVVFEYDSWGGKDINVPLVTTLNPQGKSSIPVAISTYNSIFVDGYTKIVPTIA